MRPKVPLFYLPKISIITFLCLIWHFLGGNAAFGQNFIPNGDFEQFDTCPNNLGQLKFAEPWFNATYPASEYFNTCSVSDTSSVPTNYFGLQQAQSGSGYCGLYVAQTGGPPYREFIEAKLTSPLVANTAYNLVWYASVADISSCFPASICVYLTSDSMINYTTTAFLTQAALIEQQFCNPENTIFNDTSVWVKINCCFIANGDERFIVLGNNYSDLFIGCSGDPGVFQAAYLYIDNISLMEMPTQTVRFDTAVCKGQPVQINLNKLIEEPGNTNPIFVWDDGYIGAERLLVHNKMYTVTVDNGCATDTAIIQLNYLEDCPEVFYMPNAFSPNGDGINDNFRITNENITILNFEIYNRYGKQIVSVYDYLTGWDGNVNGAPADVGVYIYQMRYRTNISETFYEKKGYVTLIR